MENFKCIIFAVFMAVPGILQAQTANVSLVETVEVFEVENSLFKKDKFWRGADGAATVELENGSILWLFSDTFIDCDGTGKRGNAKMINNSVAIQHGKNIENATLRFYTGGTANNPESFFDLPGETWFWTGHGTVVKGKLVIFLFEEEKSSEGLGFKSIGWSLVIVENPGADPALWKMNYVKGPETFGVIVGSSAVLKDERYIYAYGVKEPGAHDVYLLRFEIDDLLKGNLSGMEWWTGGGWNTNLTEEPKLAKLFQGQTEFSVHFDSKLKKYLEIQTFGFGESPLCYRLAAEMHGPWPEPVMFYQPKLNHPKEFLYTANAHPEIDSEFLYITYNINNFDFNILVGNEEIYFPKLLKIKFKK